MLEYFVLCDLGAEVRRHAPENLLTVFNQRFNPFIPNFRGYLVNGQRLLPKISVCVDDSRDDQEFSWAADMNRVKVSVETSSVDMRLQRQVRGAVVSGWPFEHVENCRQ